MIHLNSICAFLLQELPHLRVSLSVHAVFRTLFLHSPDLSQIRRMKKAAGKRARIGEVSPLA